MTLQYTFTKISLVRVCKCREKQGVVVWPSTVLEMRGPTQRGDESRLPPEVVGGGETAKLAVTSNYLHILSPGLRNL